MLPGKAGGLGTCQGQHLRSWVPLPPLGISAVPPLSKSQRAAAPQSQEGSCQREMGAGAGACLQSEGGRVCAQQVPVASTEEWWLVHAGRAMMAVGLAADVGVVAAGMPAGGPVAGG